MEKKNLQIEMLDWFLRWPSYHSIALLMSTIEVNAVRLHLNFEERVQQMSLAESSKKSEKGKQKWDKKGIKSSTFVTVQINKRKNGWKVSCISNKPEEKKILYKKCPRDKTCALKPFWYQLILKKWPLIKNWTTLKANGWWCSLTVAKTGWDFYMYFNRLL